MTCIVFFLIDGQFERTSISLDFSILILKKKSDIVSPKLPNFLLLFKFKSKNPM